MAHSNSTYVLNYYPCSLTGYMPMKKDINVYLNNRMSNRNWFWKADILLWFVHVYPSVIAILPKPYQILSVMIFLSLF